MEGKQGYKPKKGHEDRYHVIGEGDNPVAIMKKSEVSALFTPFFYYAFEVWRKYHAGLGLPGGVPWDAIDPDLANAVETMENHYEQHFSIGRVTNLYLEALIKRIDNLTEITAKKG